MDLREYGRVLVRRGWIVVVVALVGALGAFLFSRLQTPVYRSTITLSAVPSRSSDYGQSLAIKNLLRLYGQQMQTKSIAQQVIDQLQLDKSPESFLGGVEVSADEADYTIQVAVKDRNLPMVQPMAQKLAENFVILHQQENLEMDQSDRILVKILDDATPPTQFSPNTRVNVLAGAVLGALAGVVAIFLIEFIQSAYLRQPEDIERVLGLTVLGTIPALRAKPASSQAAAPVKTPLGQKA